MSDNDLERKLRSQPGPREEGYTPTRLPMSLEEARNRRSSPTPLVRGGLFAGAAVAGVLAVAVAAVVLSGPPDHGVGSGPSASPSGEPSGSSRACAPEDVTLSAEPWGGAAGSRGTIVTATLSPGRDGCQIASEPAAQITDAAGTVLVSSPPDATPGTVSLLAGHPESLSVVWSNWCGDRPQAEPLTLSIDLGLGSMMPVPVPAGGDDPVPPCSGSGSSTLGAHLQGELQ
ncbi:MAG: hypothetical protein E6J47_01050 [Chloroflexi bacterium]|nr:MAG: hypothetical protein E6J47_01050 [Chloroflexota bacterium]